MITDNPALVLATKIVTKKVGNSPIVTLNIRDVLPNFNIDFFELIIYEDGLFLELIIFIVLQSTEEQSRRTRQMKMLA